ncbi:alpha/beta fold hydrolase [Nocardioides sp. zg-DK7169]|nr:alpha/beta fold hydrolase [Nocardioides sp. zg-DK7169]
MRLVVLVTVVALVLGTIGVAISALTSGSGSGSSDGSGWTPAPTGAADPGAREAPAADLQEFYDQTVDWQRCSGEGDFECAQVEVPLDYADPDAESIELALLRAPATDPEARIGSLLVNPGGPGAPGTTYAAQSSQAFRPELTRVYDIVGFDPRGTGSSSPVDCVPDAALDRYLAQDPVPDSDAEAGDLVFLTRAFNRGCVERSGEIAAHVSTAEAARDLDVLRAALDEDTLTYFGASYGTQLGATYAELFPDRVGRMVLDGGVDVTLDARESSLGQARGFETALRAYVQNCVDAGDCFLGDSVEAGLERISGLLDDLDAKPLPTQDGREVGPGTAFLGIATPLYNRTYWDLLDQALQRAFDGDGTVLQLLADSYASRGPDGYLDNSTEAIVAVRCLDDPASVPAGRIPEEFAAFDEAAPTFGRVFAWGLLGCVGYSARSEEEPLDIRGEGAAPILVIGTTRDPATPYEWSVALADTLESGVLLTRDGDGHTGYNAGNACVDEIVEAYLIDGTVPEDGQRC